MLMLMLMGRAEVKARKEELNYRALSGTRVEILL